MVYANDRWLQMPVADLYDTQMMTMAINAAKDMYEKGQQQIKDFQKDYGDFYTPISKDMNWYNENVVGKMRNTIDSLYANGIDPLRSAEGRAAISKAINSIDTGKIGMLKQSAASANEYLKNKAILDSKGLWNPEYEKAILGGMSLDDWDTINQGQMWDRRSPGEYKDLNQFTSHIFDNLSDSYIGTKNNYDYYGVTANDLYNSLTSDTIGGLLNSDLGRFHYNNAKNDLINQGIDNPTQDQIMQQFKNNIVFANNERIHQNRKLNELWKMNQENAARRASSSGINPVQGSQQWSFMETVKRNMITSITGRQIQEYSKDLLNEVRDDQIRYGKEISKRNGGNSWKPQSIRDFKSMYGQNTYRRNDIVTFLGYPLVKKDDYVGSTDFTMIIPKSDLSRLYDDFDVVSNTTGFRGKKLANTNLSNLKDADVVTITPTQGSYGALMKDDRYKNYFEMTVVPYKKVVSKVKDAQGNYKEVSRLVPQKSKTMQLDSHITSLKNAPGTGSLGVPSKTKPGAVHEMSGLPTVDTHDTRYQDAMIGDKIVTDEIIKGTIFGSDAILPELNGYAR